MININIYDMPYVCRTKDLLWAHETDTMVSSRTTDLGNEFLQFIIG